MKLASLNCFKDNTYPSPDKVHLFIQNLLVLSAFRDNNDGWVNLSSKKMKELYGNDYKELVSYLQGLHNDDGYPLLKTDNHYLKGLKSKSFRLTSQAFESGIFRYDLASGAVMRKLLKKLTNPSNQGDYKRFCFDTDGYLGWIEKSDIGSKISVQQIASVISWENGLFWNHRDSFSKRLHHSVISFKKEFRRYISYEGNPVWECDMKGCQPFILASLIYTPSICAKANDVMIVDDLQEKLTSIRKDFNTNRFVELCLSGEIYTFLQDKLNTDHSLLLDRKALKKETLKIFFGVYFHRSNLTAVFEDYFPEIALFFSRVNRTKQGGKDFAQLLQRIESYIFIDTVKSDLEKHNIPHITIHDAILTGETYAYGVSEKIKDYSTKILGFNPTVKVCEIK